MPISTRAIFRHLYEYASPILPYDVRDEMAEALAQLEDRDDITRLEAEETLIVFAKKAWPYRKAYEDILAVFDAHYGEQFLKAHMPGRLWRRYQEFLAAGGEYYHVKTGRGVNFFTSEERVLLCGILVDMRQSVRDHVAQAIRSTEKKKFDNLVAAYENALADIDVELAHIRALADKEQEHPRLARQLRAEAEAFEHGLALLGPEQDAVRLCELKECVPRRRRELHVLGFVTQNI